MKINISLEKIAENTERIAAALEKIADLPPYLQKELIDFSKMTMEDNNLEKLADEEDENQIIEESVDNMLGLRL